MPSALFVIKDPSDFFLDCPLSFTTLPIWVFRHTLSCNSPVTSVTTPGFCFSWTLQEIFIFYTGNDIEGLRQKPLAMQGLSCRRSRAPCLEEVHQQISVCKGVSPLQKE